jgi:myo-inositol-1(or 4)-monophosphatase
MQVATNNRPEAASALPPDITDQLPDVEREAVAMAREAGRMVSSLFGQSVQVDYKDDKQTDPVTAADLQSQSYLVQAITQHFPDHGILGEEKSDDEEQEARPPDWLWVLDPLDGTTNFLNGLPVWGVSIGVMYRGLPVAAALYLPWPQADGGFVLHASKGGGAFQDEQKLELLDPEEIIANRLSGIPGSFGGQYRVGKALRSKAGEMRVTGSIAYELAMVARGVMQYCVIGGPRLWDMAAGVLLVAEAGGSVMLRRRKGWEPMVAIIPTWDTKTPNMKELRGWVQPLVAGKARIAPMVASNLKSRRPSALRRVRQFLRRMKARQAKSRRSSNASSAKAPSTQGH